MTGGRLRAGGRGSAAEGRSAEERRANSPGRYAGVTSSSSRSGQVAVAAMVMGLHVPAVIAPLFGASESGRRHNRAVACDLSSRDAGDSLSRAGVGGAPTLEAPMVRITSAARAHRICEAVTKRARGLPSESPRQRAVPALDSPVAARLRLTKDRQSHSLRQRRELRQHLSEDARIARCVASSSKRRERDTVGEKRR